MAYLRNLTTQEDVYLLDYHTFGRREDSVDTHIVDTIISKIHAVIEWKSNRWWIKNLGRNGTLLDRKQLAMDESAPLIENQIITFAFQERHQWRVENLDAPRDMLIGLDERSSSIFLAQHHLLPDFENPEAALYKCQEHHQWVFETLPDLQSSQKNSRVVAHNDRIQVGQCVWRVHLNPPQSETMQLESMLPGLEDIEFYFVSSLNEEHIQLSLRYSQKTVELGERSHHYLLLHLARRRSEHSIQGFSADDQGWVSCEQLARELGIDISHINIQVFRARKQISDMCEGVYDIESLFQRRRGDLRLACHRACVVKNGAEYQLFNSRISC